MSAYAVIVHTPEHRYAYPAIGPSSADVHMSALDRFGGLCSVSVIPL
jgi:hypothetical protein